MEVTTPPVMLYGVALNGRTSKEEYLGGSGTEMKTHTFTRKLHFGGHVTFNYPAMSHFFLFIQLFVGLEVLQVILVTS